MSSSEPNVTDGQLLLEGIEHHKNGRLPQAEVLYRRLLEQRPDHPDALNLLGVIALQAGRGDIAADLISRSVAIAPTFGSLNNLGEALRNLGRLEEAVAAYHRSLQLNPQHGDAYANLALALSQQRKIDESVVALERAIQLLPQRYDLHDRLGVLYLEQGDPYRAIASHRKAIAIEPRYAPAHANLGLALSKTASRRAEAVASCRRAVELAPEAPAAHASLASVLQHGCMLEEAAIEFKEALRLDPKTPDHYGKLSVSLEQQDRVDDAIETLQEGIRQVPGDARLYRNLSGLQRKALRYSEAVAAADAAIKLSPNFSDAHGNRALALLALGDYENGFAEYEWRWRCDDFTTKPRDFDRPMWVGSDPTGRTILVHTEQGFGDTMQFARYIPMLADRGANVIVECHHSLRKLMMSLRGVNRVVINGLKLPDFDLHTPLLSLPRAFGTTLSTVPNDVPYLHADASRVDAWRGRITSPRGKLGVGLIWAGNANPDSNRTVPSSLLRPLAGIAGVQFYSLQKHESDTYAPPPPELNLIDLAPDLTDFHETAAAMTVLDLIVTIDTGPAHLAGALGRPTWTLVPWSPDWRWMLHRDDSPWYPTMRVFRQAKKNDWADVVKRVGTELQNFAPTQEGSNG